MKSNRLIWIIAALAVGLLLMMMSKQKKTEAPESLVKDRPAPVAGDLPADTLNTVAARLGEVSRNVESLSNRLDQIEQENKKTATADPASQKQKPFGSLEELERRLKQEMNKLKAAGSKSAGNKIDQPAPLPQNQTYAINTGITTEADVWVGPLSTNPEFEDAQFVQPDSQTKPAPGFTVPRNSIIEGQALTALIGRIPFDGTVQDPYPVRIITRGNAILAGRAHWPDDLDRMIWSGVAAGDWALSCVRVRLTSVTFIFDNGDIATFEDENLGTISDQTGIPCIRGEKITNAAPALSARFTTAALEAAARGYAQAQVVTTQGASGTTVSIDDALAYGGYKALAGGMADTKSWIDQRLGQIFDAVFVQPGSQVAVHVDREIPLDKGGRKIAQQNSRILVDTLD